MLSPREALAILLGKLAGLEDVERLPLAQSVGRVLAREVVSDIDLPPFRKSAMDGFAVHAADFEGSSAPAAERTLSVLGESRAGAPFAGEVPRGACVAIYTGAEVPRDCDAVVMVELSRSIAGRDGAEIALRDRPRAGQHVCDRGQDLASGSSVLHPHRRLRNVDLAVLASVGCELVPVYRRPRVAVLTSGDELVPVGAKPAHGEIREGNTLHLTALSQAAGADALNLGVVRDDPRELERAFAAALERCDALVSTGGVSMGKYDLVGDALARVGVEPVFHRVAIKPGKPLWFGMKGRIPVFALPGNPVSCLVNHEVFVRPALGKLGNAEPEPELAQLRRGRWSGKDLEPNPREQYLPVRCIAGEDGIEVLEPVRWNGSADVVGISRAEALAIVPIDARIARGDLLAFRRLG